MSSVSKLQQEIVANYINASSNVLFLFNCIITLSQEVDVIWRRKWNATTWLYALTRYGPVCNEIALLMPVGNFVSCNVVMRIDEALQLSQFLCLAWFSALRVYALSDSNYVTTASVLLMNLVPFATNIPNYATTVMLYDGEACTALPGLSNYSILSLSLATRVSVIIGDVLVLAVTWIKTARAYQEGRRLNVKTPLVTILFRDGTVYFLILLVINVLQVIEINTPVLLAIDVIQPFLDTLPPMIVCHFILNLRQFESSGSSWASSNQSHSLRFVGNMGQSLQFGEEAEVGEEENAHEIEATSSEGDGLSRISTRIIEDTEVDEIEEYVRRGHRGTEQEPTYADV